MRFVDCQRGHIPRAKIVLPIIEHQALGRRVEQAKFAAVQAAKTGSGFDGVQCGIKEGRSDAGGLELIDLIFHQRDERRDHHGEPLAKQGGKLEAEGLTTPGWKEREDIAAFQADLDDLSLQRSEFRIAESVFKCFEQIGHCAIAHDNTQSAPLE